MWSRFTEKARQAIHFALEEARKVGDNRVGSGHILLGVLMAAGDQTALALSRLGIPTTEIQEAIRRQLPVGSAPDSEAYLTPGGKKALDYAYDEARSLGDKYIGTKHLLLGVLVFTEAVLLREESFWSRFRRQKPVDFYPAELAKFRLTAARLRDTFSELNQNTLLIPSEAPTSEEELLRPVEESPDFNAQHLLRASDNAESEPAP